MITSTPALFNALASIPVLTGIDLAAQTLLAREGIVHDFAPGAWIVREGDEGHAFFILVEGGVTPTARTPSTWPRSTRAPSSAKCASSNP